MTLVLTRTNNDCPSRFTTIDADTIIWACEAPNLASAGYGEHVWLLELNEPETEGKYYYTPEWKNGDIPDSWEYGVHDTKPFVCFRQGLIRKVWYVGKVGEERRLDWKRISRVQKTDSFVVGSSIKAGAKRRALIRKVKAVAVAATLLATGFVARPVISDVATHAVATARYALCDSMSCRIDKSQGAPNPFLNK